MNSAWETLSIHYNKPIFYCTFTDVSLTFSFENAQFQGISIYSFYTEPNTSHGQRGVLDFCFPGISVFCNSMCLHSPCITLWSSLPASVFTASQIFVVCYHAPFGCLPSLDTFTSQTHPSSSLTIVSVPFFFFCYFFPFSSPSPLHIARPDVSSWLNHSHLGFLWLHLHPPGVCSSQSSSWCTFAPTWIKVPPWAATRWISMFFFLWSFLLTSWKVSSGVSTSRRFGKVFPKILGVKLLRWFHQLILPPKKCLFISSFFVLKVSFFS